MAQDDPVQVLKNKTLNLAKSTADQQGAYGPRPTGFGALTRYPAMGPAPKPGS
jgi:hypothetical protein